MKYHCAPLPLSNNKALELPGARGRVQREAAADGHQREREQQEEVAQEQVRQLPRGRKRKQGQQSAAQGRRQGRALMTLNYVRPKEE